MASFCARTLVWSDSRETASEKCRSSTSTKPKAIRNSALDGVATPIAFESVDRASFHTASPSRTSELNSQSNA